MFERLPNALFFVTDDVHPKMIEHNGVNAVTSLYILQQKVTHHRSNFIRFSISQKLGRLNICSNSRFSSVSVTRTTAGFLVLHMSISLAGCCRYYERPMKVYVME